MIFLRIIMNLKREVRSASIKNILICIAISLGVGAFSPLLFYNGDYYFHLTKPVLALNVSAFILMRTVMLILAGFASGIVVGNCDSCRKRRRFKGIILALMLLTLNFLFYPVFFLWNSLLFATLLSVVITIISFLTARMYVKVSILSGLIMLLYTFWTLYGIIVNFCIMIVNWPLEKFNNI